MEIRELQPQDFGSVRRVARETWADAYAGIVPESVQRDFLEHAYSGASLARRMEAGVFLVAVDLGEVVGFVDLSPNPGDPSALKLAAIYVLPGFQGRGIGTGLLQAALARFPSAREVTAEVERENLAARRFYEARGFGEKSRRTYRAFGYDFHLVEMALPLEWSG